MESRDSRTVSDRESARAELARQCERHGAQSDLARRCGVPSSYINRIVKVNGMPSGPLRIALERETGIPATAWGVELWTRQKAADAVAAQALVEPFPGYTAARCGMEVGAWRAVLAGQGDAPWTLRAWARDVLGIPEDAWGALG